MTAPIINHRLFVALIVLTSLYLAIPITCNLIAHLIGSFKAISEHGFGFEKLIKMLIIICFIPFDM